MGRLLTARSAPWAAFVLALAIMGLPYWWRPYDELNLPSALYGPGLVAAGLFPIVLCGWLRIPLRRAATILGAVAPTVVLARVVVEATLDPTSHNLWPLEVLIATVVGSGVALAGAVVGRLLGAVRG